VVPTPLPPFSDPEKFLDDWTLLDTVLFQISNRIAQQLVFWSLPFFRLLFRLPSTPYPVPLRYNLDFPVLTVLGPSSPSVDFGAYESGVLLVRQRLKGLIFLFDLRSGSPLFSLFEVD